MDSLFLRFCLIATVMKQVSAFVELCRCSLGCFITHFVFQLEG